MNEHTKSTESRILFLVILDLKERLAPSLGKDFEMWGDGSWTDETASTDRDGSVFAQASDALGIADDGNETVDEWKDEWFEGFG